MNKVIWSLFDGSGLAAQPWAEAGYTIYCFNADSADHGPYSALETRFEHQNVLYVNEWISPGFAPDAPAPDFIMAFPPCTDLAVSGAAHFARKRAENPEFQVEAARTCMVAAVTANRLGVPYMIENPVSVLSSMWRKPDCSFHPWEYGGYLPEDDKHPFFPEYIAARDAYPKKTCLWTGNGFRMPAKKSVPVPAGYSAQHSQLGGKSQKTKIIRSLTPRGFAKAVCLYNKQGEEG